ncbi:outer membrane protein assembly factor BamE [Geomonas paludis]|nr:outer membrane protein assembly factor BamE [Geomonas paludis]UPU34302.1 outer membrane protein assembly factor BamE [Geomonas paludis]
MKNEINRKIRLALLGCAVVVGAVFWFLFGDSIQERLNRREFDSTEWKNPKNVTYNIRIRMVNDLLRRHHLTGMSREQVIAIIGEPDKTQYFKDWDMVYWLGPERGFLSVDSEWLVMRFNSQKKVSEVKVVRD